MNARWGGPATFAAAGPSYTNAPVVETSLMVQFKPSPNWNLGLLGLFQERVKGTFPRFEMAQPIVLAQPPFAAAGLQFRARGLYINEKEGRLLQVQDDAFAVNWRKASPDTPYPRYPSLREQFIAELEGYLAFLNEHGIPELPIAGCQVSYVNILEPRSGLTYADLGFVVPEPGPGASEGVEMSSMSAMAAFRNSSSQLSYNIAPALRIEDNATVTQFVLNSSARQVDASGRDLLDGIDGAHDLLIKVFERMTSENAKRTWGKK